MKSVNENLPTSLCRPNILPKHASDYPLLIFVSIMIPITYWFEIWVVLPSIFSEQPLLYWSLFLFGHFVLHNVVGNFLGIIMIDTSIRGRVMPSENEPGALFCTICNTATPPRSYHCQVCNICILKRDHHCLFTSCCVGFYNHRYFVLFVFYMMLSTVLSLPFNVYFLWDSISTNHLAFSPALIFPALMFFFDYENDNFQIEHLYLVICSISIIGISFCSVWFFFHLNLILKGTVVYEMRRCIHIYDLGREKNLEMVFGKRWHLSWISPFIKSPLICDGVRFPKAHGEKED